MDSVLSTAGVRTPERRAPSEKGVDEEFGDGKTQGREDERHTGVYLFMWSLDLCLDGYI